MIQKDYIIIGAGLSGLTIANALTKKNPELSDQLLLIDKGYYAGGRCSSRSVGSNKTLVDFGIAGSNLKQQLFDSKNLKIEDESKLSARHLVQNLTHGLNILTKTRIQTIQHNENSWTLTIENSNDCFQCKQLIITAPVPQTIDLLSNLFQTNSELKAHKSILEEITYDRSISLMFTDALFINFIKTHQTDLLNTIARQIYFNDSESSVTIVLNAKASLDYWDYSSIELTNKLFPSFPNYDDDTEISVHRWRYGFSDKGLNAPMILILGNLNAYIFNDAIGSTSNVVDIFEKANQFVDSYF